MPTAREPGRRCVFNKKMGAFAYSLSGYTHPTIQLFKLSVFHPHIDLCHVLIHNKRHKEQKAHTEKPP